jgi:uncharacterized membrane protein SpoIIM required for sporulation
MQETEFIAQNKEKWNEFEEVLKSKDKDPDRLTSLFVEMTDDLSYAQTNYPNRSVKVYLNGVSQKIHTAIYKNKRDRKSNRKGFWSVELPAALWAAHKPLLFAFVLFTLGISIGVFSNMYYPDFARIVLSDGYVEMTEQFIKEGDPMQVYKDRDQLEMFFMIAINNIQISLAAFVLGLLWGVGTAYVLLSNGIMFGAFMHFFFKRDLGTESVLTVMQHGTLELSMIVISGAAGFMIAKGILFPGTYTRLESMVMQARHAIKVMIPVFILLLYAAFIESFLTRYTELPNALRAFSIILSAAIVLGYFVWYPYYQFKKGVFNKTKDEEIPIGNRSLPRLNAIKPTSLIFNETFAVFYKASKPIAAIALVMGILITFALGMNAEWTYSNYYSYNNISDFNALYFLWYWTPYIALTAENPAILFYGLYAPALATVIVSYFIICSKTFSHAVPKNIFLQFINALIISLIVLLTFELPDFVSFLILIFLWPICLLWLSATWNAQTFLFSSEHNFGSLIRHNFGKTLANFWNIQGIQWITLLVLNGSILTIFGIIFTGRPANLLWVFLEFIQMNVPRNWSFAAEVPYFTYTLILIFGLLFVLSFSIISTYLIFFSAKEISSSESLLQSIQNIGTKKRAYGIEKEA